MEWFVGKERCVSFYDFLKTKVNAGRFLTFEVGADVIAIKKEEVKAGKVSKPLLP